MAYLWRRLSEVLCVLQALKVLITDGFFARVRHPNYLGEMLLYGSFAWVSQDPFSWAILFWVWGGLFLPYMLRKEASMSRYEGWKAYTKKASFLIPRFW
jgi:protein-S-isoprenylcysteine O-methyltransferase Ste14